MPRLDGLKSVLDYMAGLQPKIAGQIARKVMALAVDPAPRDSEALAGTPGYRRVDVGEHRMVYLLRESDDVVEILLVGKRNDDDVYRRLRRLLG